MNNNVEYYSYLESSSRKQNYINILTKKELNVPDGKPTFLNARIKQLVYSS